MFLSFWSHVRLLGVLNLGLRLVRPYDVSSKEWRNHYALCKDGRSSLKVAIHSWWIISFLKSGFQVHSGLNLPAYEDLDIEFFLFRWRYSKTSDATPPCSALVKLLRRFWRAFSCFWSKKRCRALFWFPIDPSPLNVVVLLKPFGHVKNLLWGQTKMADKDFEEFSDNLDELPQHFRATDKTYQ